MALAVSTSVPASVIGNAVASGVARPLCGVAVGASFTGLTVIDTVAVLLSEAPSLALYVKLSAPLKLAVGV